MMSYGRYPFIICIVTANRDCLYESVFLNEQPEHTFFLVLGASRAVPLSSLPVFSAQSHEVSTRLTSDACAYGVTCMRRVRSMEGGHLRGLLCHCYDGCKLRTGGESGYGVSNHFGAWSLRSTLLVPLIVGQPL